MDEALEAMCVVTKNLGVAFGGQQKSVDVIVTWRTSWVKRRTRKPYDLSRIQLGRSSRRDLIERESEL